LRDVLKSSRRVEADLIAFIAEVDARRLYALEASPSMHAYCIDVLHLSEPETALRIHVARAIRKHPMLLSMLREGRLHLSGIALLAPHLTPKNRQGLLKRATYKSRRQIEEIVAELKPRPAAPAQMRKLPAPRADATGRAPRDPCSDAASPTVFPRRHDDLESPKSQKEGQLEREHRPDDVAGPNSLKEGTLGLEPGPDDVAAAPALRPRRPATVEPLAPALYQVKFTAGQELHDKLERLQALMRTTVPNGDLGAIIDAAVTEKLERLEAKKLGKTKAPRKTLAETDTTPTSRYIPAPVRREVWERDGGRCTYVDRHGRRCAARERLEFHHHGTPFGRGGVHSPGVIRLACKTHNTLLAELDFGKKKMARYRRGRPSGDHVAEAGAAFGGAACHPLSG